MLKVKANVLELQLTLLEQKDTAVKAASFSCAFQLSSHGEQG